MSQIFEGSEKKLEIVLKKEAPSLRSWPREEWIKVIEASNAQVLSEISNDHCDAYLLSESSLFVWDHSMVFITCGTTTLVHAAELLAQNIPEPQREAFFFQRKNEYFPHLQKSNFYEDVDVLKHLTSGQAVRLGKAGEHHMFLYNSDNKMDPDRLGSTLEVLMYDLQGAAKDVFNCEGSSVDDIRLKTQVNKLLPGFEVDDFCFQPTGYSLNAIKDQFYYTVHVTPQDVSPYVSFETNAIKREDVFIVLNSVIEIFRPQNFDLVFFDQRGSDVLKEFSGYRQMSQVNHEIGGVYQLQFAHFAQGDLVPRGATPI